MQSSVRVRGEEISLVAAKRKKCDEQPPKRASVFVRRKQNDFIDPETENAGSYTESRLHRSEYVTITSPPVLLPFFTLNK
jgi:hypothetical protein